MADTFHQCTWGRLKLWLASISSEASRTLVIHELSSGDEHPISDRGMGVRRSRCDLLFDDWPSETSSPTDRFRQFQAQVALGIEQLFTHPVDGSYMARVGEFTYEIDDDSNIKVHAEFIASDAIESVSPAGAGTSSALGESTVAQAADDLGNELMALDIDSDLPARARDATENWDSSLEVPTRQVMNEHAGIETELEALIEEEGLEDDIELFPAWRASIMLGDAVRSAAIAATSETSATYVVRITTPLGLLPLMASIYGGAEAEDRARQAMELNDIRTPGWLAPGSYTLPRKTVGTRTRF